MTEQPKNDKTLFSLIEAATSMIDGLSTKEPEAPKPQPRPQTRPAQRSFLEAQKLKEHQDSRGSILETAALALLVDLRSKGLIDSHEKVTLSINSDDKNSQFVTLSLTVEK